MRSAAFKVSHPGFEWNTSDDHAAVAVIVPLPGCSRSRRWFAQGRCEQAQPPVATPMAGPWTHPHAGARHQKCSRTKPVARAAGDVSETSVPRQREGADWFHDNNHASPRSLQGTRSTPADV